MASPPIRPGTAARLGITRPGQPTGEITLTISPNLERWVTDLNAHAAAVAAHWRAQLGITIDEPPVTTKEP